MVYYQECRYLFKKENGLNICTNKERIEKEKCKPYCKKTICIYSAV